MASPDTVTKVVKFLDTHNGRDKVVRTIQYGSRFLTWYLAKHSYSDASKKFVGLENASSMARKLFRLAKSIAHFQTALKTVSEENDVLVKITVVIQQLSLGLWLLYDHVIWAGKLNLIKSDRMPTYTRRANIFWLIAMLMGIVKSLYLAQQNQMAISAQLSSKSDAVASLRKKHTEIMLEFFRNLFDVPIPLTALNQSVGALIPSGIVGLFGTGTSLIGIYQAWTKIK